MAQTEPNVSPSGIGPDTPGFGSQTSGFGRDVAAVVLLVASLVGMFWKVIFTSAMFFYRDVYNYTFPSARFIHDICRQGFLPYWNPYLNYGQPVLANPNLLFFYPFTLLIVLLPVDIAYTMHFLVHFALAGIGVYVLARSWGQTYQGAFFAAFVFMFSGPVLSLGDLYNESACAAWIPWALLVTDRALGEPAAATMDSADRDLLVPVAGRRTADHAGDVRPLLCLRVLSAAALGAKLWSKPNFRLARDFLPGGRGNDAALRGAVLAGLRSAQPVAPRLAGLAFS